MEPCAHKAYSNNYIKALTHTRSCTRSFGCGCGFALAANTFTDSFNDKVHFVERAIVDTLSPNYNWFGSDVVDLLFKLLTQGVFALRDSCINCTGQRDAIMTIMS